MDRPSRALGVAIAVPVLALVVAGCGGAPSPAAQALSAVAVVRAAAATTSNEHSSRLVTTTHTEVGAVTVDFTGEGLFDYAAGVGQLSMTLPGSTAKLDEILLKDKLYLKVPGQGPAYYVLNRQALVGTSLGSTAAPTSGLETLTAISDDVRKVDRVTVRDAPTTHYAGTLDLARAAQKASGLAKTALQSLATNAATTAVPFDAYIDGKGRLRKLIQRLTTTSPKLPGQQVHVISTLELFDFGVAVRVQAPSQVKDGAPLLAAINKQFATTR
jgi:hypothetical protein